MNTKSLFLLVCIAWLLTACGANYINWTANANMKKVTLGMSKQQVIKTLGPDYLVASSATDAQGNQLDVLAYKSDVDEEYKLVFVNGQLKEWNREHINRYIVKDRAP